MHAFIASRYMAQVVAFDLIDEERRQADLRKGRRDRRRAARAARDEETESEPRRHRWHVPKALHLVH